MLSKAELGERIRSARLGLGMTLKEVGAAARLSAPHICEIEQGKTSPTFGALAKIAAALGKPVAYFLEEESLPEVSVVRHDERIADRLAGAGRGLAAGASPLSEGIPSSHLAIRRLLLAPHQETAVHSHDGQEGGVLLAGRIEARVGEQRRMLEQGDVTFFASEQAHQLHNPGPDTAELLWIHLVAMPE